MTEDMAEASEGEAGEAYRNPLPPPAPKLRQDDPSLRVRPVGRRLRKGPVAATLVGLVVFAALLVGLANSVRGSNRSRPAPERADDFPKPVIPESIRNASVVIEREPPIVTPPDPGPRVELPALPETSDRDDDGPYSAAALRRKRVADYWKARGSAILVQSGSDPVVGQDEETIDDERQLEGAAYAPMPSKSRELGSETDPNLQGHKNDFVDGADRTGSTRALAIVRHPHSPYELKPGTIVPAVLETAINSDLPGPVIARVTQNICDSVHGDWLLIPQGSTLVAYYDSMVAWGQERVLVCWKQLELPNGDSLELGCMPAADSTGQAGFHDQVDEHWWRIIKGAAVASLLSAATTAASGNTQGYNPTIPQMWARGAASEIGNVGEQITRRNIQIQPTLTIRQGMPANVVITRTIDFRPDGPGTPCRQSGL